MDAALQKALGELLLNAVPTILIFLTLLAAYTFLVHRPLMRVLEQRHALTEGAVAKAQTDIAAADAKSSDYEQRLRAAKAEVFKQMEALRKKHMEARAAVLQDARNVASARVKTAKGELDKEAATAKVALQAQSEELAQQVIRRVLGSSAAPMAGAK